MQFSEMNLFLFSQKCKRPVCLNKRKDAVTVRGRLLSVGMVFASFSLSINQAAFAERSGKASGTASSLQRDSRATRILFEKMYTGFSERIFRFIVFCLISVIYKKPKHFSGFFAQ